MLLSPGMLVLGINIKFNAALLKMVMIANGLHHLTIIAQVHLQQLEHLPQKLYQKVQFDFLGDQQQMLRLMKWSIQQTKITLMHLPRSSQSQ